MFSSVCKEATATHWILFESESGGHLINFVT